MNCSCIYLLFFKNMTQPADWQGAQLVQGGNMARAEFTVAASNGAVTRARLYILGLGYYQSWINGQAST